MKKLLFGILLALGLFFAPITIKAEDAPIEEPPVAEIEEPKDQSTFL